MPKTLLYSRQPLAKRPLQHWLDDTAANIVLVTTPAAVEGQEHVLATHFAGHQLVDDYGSWAAEAAAEHAALLHDVDLVACTSESDVLRAARLREHMGLPGQSVTSATAYRDKAVMKRVLHEAGLPVARFTEVDGPLKLVSFFDSVDGPAVVKPRFGAGAEDVHVLRTRVDVGRFLALQNTSSVPFLPGQWMIEEFVRGDFFHVDGVMHDGHVVHCWPSQYDGGVAEHVLHQTQLSSVLLAATDERTHLLRSLAQEVVGTLPSTSGPLAFHLEAWITPGGEPVVCEIASRAGGGPIAEAYERAFGIHLAREGLRAQCGSALTLTHQPDTPTAPLGWIVFPPGHGRFDPPGEPCSVPGTDLTVHLASGTVSTGLEYAAQSAASAFVTGNSPDQVRERIALVLRWWESHSPWKSR